MPRDTTRTRPPAAESGVIHDIGYRHYDGPRLGRAYARRSLYVDSARAGFGLGRVTRAKVVPLLLLVVMCLPAVVAVAVTAIVGAGELPLAFESYAVMMQVVVAVYVAAQAPVSVSRDLRFGVLSLLFSRPLQRRDYVLAKYAALATDVFALLALPLTLLFLGVLLVRLPIGENLPDYLTSLATAAVLAVVLAGIGLVIAAVTPRRGLGVAAIVTVLLVLSGVQAVVQEVLIEEGSADAAGWSALISPFTLVDGVGRGLLGAERQAEVGPPGVGTGLVFALVAALVVAVCWVLLLRRFRKVSVS